MDDHIGIDYSLLQDPSVSPDTLDLDFKVRTASCPASPRFPRSRPVQHGAGLAALRLQKPLLLAPQGMFFYRARESQELENHAVEPVIKETERMVYVAFSEYFFDSAMHAYFQAGVLAIELEGEKVRSEGHRWAGAGEGGSTRREAGGAARGAALPGAAVTAPIQRFLLPAGAQGPGGFAESHLLRDHLHAGEGSSPLGRVRHGGGPGCVGTRPCPGSPAAPPRTLPWWMRPCAWCFRCRPPPAA